MEQLVEALRRRDPAAMGRLYDLVGRRAHGLAYRILQDDGEAEDAVQDAFLTLWRMADRIDPARGRVIGLLLTIVHRRSIDLLRARQNRSARTRLFETAPEPVDTIDVEAGRWPRWTATCCRRAWRRSRGTNARCSTWPTSGGLSYREIAERLEVRVGPVKSRIRLGIGKLREHVVIGGRDGL